VTATVLYDDVNELAYLTNTWLNTSGTPTDPSTITCAVTDPGNNQIVHTYAGAAPADIQKALIGKYTLAVSCAPSVAGSDGLWLAEWIGVGSGLQSNVQPNTWRVFPPSLQRMYCGLEELKDRLGITDNSDDFALEQAIQAATTWTTEWCGQHFYQVTETRTFVPRSIWEIDIDPLVTVTAVNVDQSGSGVFAESWVLNSDYQLKLGVDLYNANAAGVKRPFKKIQITQTGKFFPYIYPYSHLDRVQVIGTWGWPSVPPGVSQATLMLAAQFFKEKDAPFGIAGMNDFGAVRLMQSPTIQMLLNPYVNGKRKVGVL
jgi:hypothetical protein